MKDVKRGRGRPKLDADDETIEVKVKMPSRLAAAIDVLAYNEGHSRAAYIRRLCMREVFGEAFGPTGGDK